MDVSTGTKVPHAEYFPPRPRPPRLPRGPSVWVTALASDRRELVRYWPVIQNMVVQELRVRYQRSFLGFVWTLLHPILMMTTLSLVFSKLFKAANPAVYAVYLFAGLVPWGFLSASLNECAFCIITNENLIKKIYLPKLVFPLARVLVNLTTCLLSMVALFVLMLPLGAKFSVALLALPLAIALLFAFTLGLSLIVATANTFYRDCGHLVSVVLQAWYFTTPIIYRAGDLKPEDQWKFWLNPAYPFFQMFQAIISDGTWPPLIACCVAAGIGVMTLGIGYAAFKSQEDKLVFRL